MIDIAYYTRNYHFLDQPLVGTTPDETQTLVLVARKGPYFAMVERAQEGGTWNGRLFFGMPGVVGESSTPTLLGEVPVHHHLNVVLMRLSQLAHDVGRASTEALKRKKRKKYDYRTQKKRA